MTTTHYFKSFQSRYMKEAKTLLFGKDGYVLIYNGIATAEKMAKRFNGKICRTHGSLNKFFIESL